MARKRKTLTLTAARVGRLCRLLSLLDGNPLPRVTLLKKLKVDQRSFYRDLALLKELGILLKPRESKYSLPGALDVLIGKLPFPDPHLTISEAQELVVGTTPTHAKIQATLDATLGGK
jgi:DNA-binding transcriptional ArsR family regulator